MPAARGLAQSPVTRETSGAPAPRREHDPRGPRGDTGPPTAPDPAPQDPPAPDPPAPDPTAQDPPAQDPSAQRSIAAGPLPLADRPEDPTEPSIEPTTGAPIGALPQRVPQRTVDPAGQREPVGSADPTTRTAAGPADPAGTGDDGDFWLPIEEVHWDGTPVRTDDQPARGRSRGRSVAAPGRRSRHPERGPWTALATSVALALASAFFAWVSAEPLWLALGHGDQGTAVVTACSGRGLTQHCRGAFTRADGGFTARDVTLTGVAADDRGSGSRVPAKMVGADSPKAYVEAGPLVGQLRWSLGLAMALICGVGIVWATGTLSLPEGRPRRGATLLGLAGPVLITLGFLAASF